ncbi:MAG TPA: cation diffusion facilitator family transporter [Pyrinomonadaceae bacterium]|nr:cation diffusion facilitator family transporter [Pyrinomonadaceae bacterium]
MLAVIGALIANGLITVLKFIAAAITGSSGMMAEALHSLADTTNQVFLLLGLRFYKRPASEKHPFGYGKERFFWSFIAAIFIFGVGASYALYEGYQKLTHPHPPAQLRWAYWVLGLSLVLEAASIALALYQEITEAHHEGLTFVEYLRESKDPTAKTVLFEDSAALIGIAIAAVGIYLTDHQVGPSLFNGQPPGAFWDGLASMAIGVVLAIVAFSLARSSRGLLLGEAATPKAVERIRQAILSHPHVCEVVELLTMHLAPKQILINAHVNFRNELGTDDIEQVVNEVEELIKKAEPKVDMIFLETARESEPGGDDPIPHHIG